MISLIEAVKLCKIQENELVYLRKRGDDRMMYTLYSLREMRKSLDMRAIKVFSIIPRFEFFGGYVGMEFEVNKVR